MGLRDFILRITDIIHDTLIPLAFALCFLYFIWGVAKYIRTGSGSEKSAEQARNVMVWGLAGVFVAASIWGIVRLMRTELGVPEVNSVRLR
jgi:hypothetical protein